MTRLRFALALLVAAGSAQAADIRPGLWEFRSTRVSLGGAPDLSEKLRQQLANLPPDVQRQLRQQLAAQDSVYAGRTDGNCTLASITKSGNQVRGRLNCSQPKGSADFETTLDGPERMSTRVNMHSAQGDIQMDTDARWIAACGTATRQE